MADSRDADVVEGAPPVPPEGRGPVAISSRVQVDLRALSHQGKVRQNNEDHYPVARFDRSMHTLATNLPPGLDLDRYGETVYAMLLADGMGGAAAGEVASRTAIGVLVDLVLQTPDWIMRLDEQRVKEVLQRFNQRFRQMREALVERAQADPSLSGMGTTMTLAGSLGTDLLIAHVGHSRAYLFRKNRLQRLTRDHTLARSLADAGRIRPEDVTAYPKRHVLTDAIGTKGEEARAEFHQVRLEDGDQGLLCTDGLTEMVTAAAIVEVLRGPWPPADACGALVGLALEGGGKDNVTVVLARYRIPE